jgi:hypothetical protein
MKDCLADRVSRLSGALDGGAEIVSSHRIERAMEHQRVTGDYYWMALEEQEPTWLEERYDGLHRELNLDCSVDCGRAGTPPDRPVSPVRRPAGVTAEAVRR